VSEYCRHEVHDEGRCPICSYEKFTHENAEKARKLADHHDSGKTRVELIDPYTLEEMGKVLAFGAEKYDPWNWTRGISYGRLLGSILRHTFAFMRREDIDPESGCHHLAHAMCDVMFLLSMTRRHPDLDDRMP